MNAATAPPRLRTVRLHGALADRFGPEWSLAVKSPREAIRAIEANRPGFLRSFLELQREGVAFRVVVGDRDLGDSSLSLEEQTQRLAAPVGRAQTIEIIPVPVGAGGGTGRIILGVVLIIVGALLFKTGAGAPLIGIGLGLLAGGLAQLLIGNQEPDDGFDDDPGSGFSGRVNTIEPGHPIPIVLGRALCGSATISLGVRANDELGTIARDQRLRVLDLVSEGPIEGLVDGNESVFFDEQKLINGFLERNDIGGGLQVPGGVTVETRLVEDSNFPSTKVETRLGTNDQEPIQGFGTSETTTRVGVELFEEQPTSRTTVSSKLSAVRVNLVVLQLFDQGKRGDIDAEEMKYEITVSDTASTWSRTLPNRLFMKVFNRRNISHEVEVEGTGPWEITVEKTVKDSNGDDIKADLAWESFTEIGDSSFSHPNSALVAVDIRSDVVSGLPTRQYLLDGLHVRIPSNYNPVTRVYTGLWDGTFKAEPAYTDNAVWAWLELARSNRFGLGQYLDESDWDIWAFYRAAQVADEMVDDGEGGLEPRFTIGYQIRKQEEGHKLLAQLTSAFLASMFWDGEKISIAQDRVEGPLYEFNPTNVIGGLFEYTSSPLGRRTNRVSVRYNDKNNFYRPTTITRDNRAAIIKFGIIEKTIPVPWVTSKGMATRLANWDLLTESLSEAVKFSTGLEGAPVLPGVVIGVQDPNKGATKVAGRIRRAISPTEIELDREVTLESGTTYDVTVYLPDIRDELVAAGNASSLTLSHPLANDDFRLARVWEDANDDGDFELRREPNGYTSSTKELTLTPFAGSGSDRDYRVEYPDGCFRPK